MGSYDLVSELRTALKDVEVVTPQSPNYKKSIERWSDASVKEAVSTSDHVPGHTSNNNTNRQSSSTPRQQKKSRRH